MGYCIQWRPNCEKRAVRVRQLPVREQQCDIARSLVVRDGRGDPACQPAVRRGGTDWHEMTEIDGPVNYTCTKKWSHGVDAPENGDRFTAISSMWGGEAARARRVRRSGVRSAHD